MKLNVQQIKSKIVVIVPLPGVERELTEEEAAAEAAGREVDDDGRILACTVHRTDKLKNDFFIMHPMVRVHVFDENTGRYLTKQHK